MTTLDGMRTSSPEVELERERLIEVRSSGRKGRGVYARRDISPGMLLARSAGIFFDANESGVLKKTAVFDHLLANPADYAPGHAGATYALINGDMSYCNHDPENNAVIQWSFEPDGLWLHLRSLHAIPAGAEVTILYTNLDEYPDAASFAP